MLRVRHLALVLVLAIAGIASAVAVAAVAATPASQPAAKPSRLAVGVTVLHFNAGGRRETATGFVTAKLTDDQGHTQTVRSQVAVTASSGGSCQVLHLNLNQLNLNLLGLNVHLDKVVLDLTGNSKGGVLGSLFCKLAKAKVAAARASATRALNQHLGANGQHVLRLSAYITPRATATAAGQTCPVLDLIVGPLNLQLLGLVVNLNQVHLTITAKSGAGVLGDLFCQLADSTTTTPTTTT